MINSYKAIIAILILATVFITGCAAPPPTDQFGASVKHMREAQIYNRVAADTPDPMPVAHDGQKAEEVIDSFWGTGADANNSGGQIQINVGN